jgi:hypothetical protein
MRKTITVAALLLALTCPAYAGDMPNVTPAPPQLGNTAQEPTTDGDMQNDSADRLTEIALELLAALSPLF